MGNMADQPSADIPNARNNTLANVSVILGILGFVLPCLAFLVWGFLLSDYLIDSMGPLEFSRWNVYIPMALWIAGPIAILVGIFASRKRDLEDIPESQKKRARAGIILGVLTIPFVLLPLIFWLLLVNACASGC